MGSDRRRRPCQSPSCERRLIHSVGVASPGIVFRSPSRIGVRHGRSHHEARECSSAPRIGLNQIAVDGQLPVVGGRQARAHAVHSCISFECRRPRCQTTMLGGQRVRLCSLSRAAQGTGRHCCRSRRGFSGRLQAGGSGRGSGVVAINEEHSSGHRARRLAESARDGLQMLLGAHLLQRYARLRQSPRIAAAGLVPSQKRRVIELLNENLAGRIHLSDMARECGLSISYFARSFKASFGMSAHRWLVHRRVERSKELMAHTTESLAEIADEAGFADQPAFTRAFHRIVGVSPGRWRRDHVGVDRPDRR
jgi:AraC-like DNA-binding protein